MSSSTGAPSKKLSWYKSMMAKFANEQKLKDIERRNAPRESSVDRRKQKQEDTIYGKG